MKRWPHAPSHCVNHPGAYIVTASTLYKQRLFDTPEKLTLLENSLLEALDQGGWEVQAWAVFNNHYHFVGLMSEGGDPAIEVARKVHGRTAVALNRLDGIRGRRVWFQAWDTAISFDRSYMARLAYVHHNPVRHGLVQVADMYPWCSAEWFAQRAERSWYETITSFPIDDVNIADDY
ncbi:MAG: transposase [Fimbriimonas sp.]